MLATITRFLQFFLCNCFCNINFASLYIATKLSRFFCCHFFLSSFFFSSFALFSGRFMSFTAERGGGAEKTWLAAMIVRSMCSGGGGWVVGIWLFSLPLFLRSVLLAVEISLYEGKEGSSTCLVLVFYAQPVFFCGWSSIGQAIGR